MLTVMPVSKREGSRKGITVREGSVAQARREAGLTLAQVADGKLSRTAIHLIEKGVTRPSMQTLTQIASQTRKPLSFFLRAPKGLSPFSERVRLQRAKRYLAEAFAAGEPTREPTAQAKVCMLLGQIEELCGNSRGADGQFERAIGILDQFGKADKLRDAHIAYAELLDGRQDVATAARHWKLAAEIGRLAALGFEWRAVTNENGEPRSAAGRRTY